MMWMFWRYRANVPLARGLAVWGVVLVTAFAAVALLWAGKRSAPTLTALSGGCLLVVLCTWPWLLGVGDMVNAVGYGDEGPSFLVAHGYQLVLGAIAVLTIVASLIARRGVRALAD